MYLAYATLCCPWGIRDTLSQLLLFLLLLLLAFVILLDYSSFKRASVLSRKWWPIVHSPPKCLLWVKLLLLTELNTLNLQSKQTQQKMDRKAYKTQAKQWSCALIFDTPTFISLIRSFVSVPDPGLEFWETLASIFDVQNQTAKRLASCGMPHQHPPTYLKSSPKTAGDRFPPFRQNIKQT